MGKLPPEILKKVKNNPKFKARQKQREQAQRQGRVLSTDELLKTKT